MRYPLLSAGFLVLAVVPAFAEDRKPAPATSELPGTGKVRWDLRGLNDRFTVVKTKYEPDERRVTWLVEAREDMAVKPADLATGLFDEDRVRLNHTDLGVEGGITEPVPFDANNRFGPPPPVQVRKGERIRIVLSLPDDEEWNKVRFVVVASKAIPTDEKK